MTRMSSRRPGFGALALLVVGLSIPLSAAAGDLSVKVEGGVALPVTQPQTLRFDPGGAAALKLMYGITSSLDLAAGMSFIGLPSAVGSPSSGSGKAWSYGGGIRFRLPYDSHALRGMSPWVDGDALYVRTGDLNRFGIAFAGVGSYWLRKSRSAKVG